MNRFDDWVVRLNNFIEKNRNREFERGVFDCALFAGYAVQEITGKNFVKKYIKNYKTKKDAFDLLKKEGLKDLSEVANKYLGKPYESINFAGRGDIVAVQ